MKMKPENKKQKQTIPTFKNYREKFIIVGVGITMGLAATSCEKKPSRTAEITPIANSQNNSKHVKIQKTISGNKNVKIEKKEKKLESKDKEIVDKHSDLSIKKPKIRLGKIRVEHIETEKTVPDNKKNKPAEIQKSISDDKKEKAKPTETIKPIEQKRGRFPRPKHKKTEDIKKIKNIPTDKK